MKGRVRGSAWYPKLNLQMEVDLGPTSKATVYIAKLLGILCSIIIAVTAREVKKFILFGQLSRYLINL
jgi:hypothetical protein